jgi:gliding motility-associated-like protein
MRSQPISYYLFFFISVIACAGFNLKAQTARVLCTEVVDPVSVSSCRNACFVCDLDEYSYVNDTYITTSYINGCDGGVGNWISFMALSESLTLEVTIRNCLRENGEDPGEDPGEDDFSIFSLYSIKGPACDEPTGFERVATSLINCEEGNNGTTNRLRDGVPKIFSTTVPLDYGEIYYLKLGTADSIRCTNTIKVLEGNTAVPTELNPIINDTNPVCVNSEVKYLAVNPLPVINYWYTLNGDTVSTVDSVQLTWQNPGIFELCLHADNICTDPMISCYDIIVNLPDTIIESVSICTGDCFRLANDELVCSEGRYDFTVLDQGGCTISYQTTLFITPPDTTQLDVSLCFGDTLTYQNEDFFLPGTYETVYSNIRGCDSLVYLTITNVNCPISGTIEGVGVSCNGEIDGSISLQLNSGFAPYTISFYSLGRGLVAERIVTDTELIYFDALAVGTYLITVEDNFGNIGLFNENIDQPDVLSVRTTTTNYNDVEVSCNGENDGQIILNAEGGVQPYSVEWADGSSATMMRSGLIAGDYSYRITDDNGCFIIDTILLDEPDPLSISFDIRPENCESFGSGGVNINTMSGGTGTLQTTLLMNNTGIELSNNTLFAGNYSLTLADGNGCQIDTMFTILRPVSSSVQIIPSSTIILLGETIQLRSAYSNQPDAIRWAYPGTTLDCDTCESVTFLPLTSARALLEAISIDGCVSVDSVFITLVSEYNVYFPTAFSPNSDGINDIFHPFFDLSAQTLESFRVYNRWGGEIYSCSKEELPLTSGTGWQGRTGNKDSQSGIYTWVATVTFIDGETRQFQGQVSLVR